jgi:hypothetical protein
MSKKTPTNIVSSALHSRAVAVLRKVLGLLHYIYGAPRTGGRAFLRYMNIKKFTAALLLFVMSVTLIGVLPQKAYAITCGAGTLVGSQCVVVLTSISSNPWTVPADWNNSANLIEVVGAGGNGSSGTATAAGAGGGGGGYASTTNVTLSGTASYQTGLGGSGNATGNDTWFSTTATVRAQSGGNASGITAGVGGSKLAGAAGFKGGNGGAGLNTAFVGGGGGGGAAGPFGIGGNGGNTNSGVQPTGGGGGGGNGGGSTGAATASATGANGGNNVSGTGAGTGGAGAGGNGTSGGGGAGGAGRSNNSTGFTGGSNSLGTEWSAVGAGTGGGSGGGGGQSRTAGGGNLGGAGGATSLSTGGGGGGGGSGNAGGGAGAAGSDGFIVITYTPAASAPTVVTNVADTVTATSANMNGNVTADGGSAVTARGFATSTVSTLSSSVSTSSLSGTTGAFPATTFSNTNLTGNTTYYFRAYATNSVGTSFGSILNFLTLPDVPGTPTYSSITQTSISVSWTSPTGGAATYNLEQCITSTNTCTLTTSIASSPQSAGSLTANTSYDFAVQGVNATGSGTWSATSTQSTSAGAPTVSTTIVDNSTITATAASIAGNITDIGSGNATARGFASSTDPAMVTGVATTTESGSFGTGAFPSSPGAFPGSMSGLTSNTTYYFRAFATNSGGTGFGAIGSLLTLPAAPGAPTYANTIATTTGITWTDPTSATNYNLEQCITSTNTCSLFTGITSNATTTYSLTGNTNYEYAVLGTNATGGGAFSATSTPALTLPDVPGTPTFSNITATNALASWSSAAGGAASYKLEICNGGGACSLFTNISSNSTTTYSLSANSSYTVAVRGTNATGDGLWSATSTLTTTLTTPGTPTYSATTATTTSVTWSASSGASSYKLEQCVTGSNTCSLFTGITSNATTTYSLTGNTSYDYAVRATAAGDSPFSATSTVLTLPNVPGTPTFTNVSITTLTVNWAGSVGSSSSYKIERCSGAGCSNFSQIASGIGTTIYNDTGLTQSTTYLYRVRGTNTTGDGLYSGAGSATTNAPSGNTGGGSGGGPDIGGSAPAGTPVGGGNEGGGQVIGSDPGFNQPSSSGSGIATGWSVGWATPANGFASDNAYATSNATSSTDYSVFGFAVPSTDTVTGITVKLEASASAGGGTIKVELSWNGGTATTTSGFTTAALTTSDVVYTLGSASTNWGRTWAPADLSDANLRVRIVAAPSSNTVKLDAIQVNVFHQATGGSSGGGGDI